LPHEGHLEWSEASWNPITGCNWKSAGCDNCYAKRNALQMRANKVARYKNGFEVTLHHDLLDKPKHWRKPRRPVFTCSMSDLFNEKVPDDFIQSVFQTMVNCSQHCYVVLTKRSERLLAMSPSLPWRHWIWAGVSVENEDVRHRLDHLRQTGAHHKLLHLEPLLGPLPNLNLDGIDWVVVAGESGHGAREMKKEWVVDIRDQVVRAGIPFLFKQWWGVDRDTLGYDLEGEVWDQKPAFETGGQMSLL
jgi:protein gp37